MILHHGDCLEVMKSIPDKSIDFILTDPPYGTTACKWDVVIPFEPMWEQLKRITKDNAAIALFGSEPFSSHLRMSNIKMFKYDWIWNKNHPSGFALAKKRPMVSHEVVSIFYKNQPLYFPEKEERMANEATKNRYAYGFRSGIKSTNKLQNGIPPATQENIDLEKRYPSSVKFFNVVPNAKRTHPTQKPVALLEYLIKTYTLENEVVLDFTMGSGSTGVAAKNLNRNFIGIEKDYKYFEIAKNRINNLNAPIKII